LLFYSAWHTELPSCRFPPPWPVDEQPACFIVKDSSGQKLAYVYFEVAEYKTKLISDQQRNEGDCRCRYCGQRA
jgi:hypothetical protein